MNPFVVDASVGVKWFLPETGSADAVRLQSPNHELHVPSFFDLELANIIWKGVRAGRLTRSEADLILSQLTTLTITRHPIEPLIVSAFEIAAAAVRTVYDSLYVALAVHLNGIVVTADDRLVNALSSTPRTSHVMRLADVP